MRILLDTQCWLWLHAEPERFGAEALAAIEDTRNRLFFSAASAWEIAIKYALGRLPLPVPPADYVPSRMRVADTAALPITLEHAFRVAELPPHHRDPFDRMLVAQGQVEGLRLITTDRKLASYDVDVIWT